MIKHRRVLIRQLAHEQGFLIKNLGRTLYFADVSKAIEYIDNMLGEENEQ